MFYFSLVRIWQARSLVRLRYWDKRTGTLAANVPTTKMLVTDLFLFCFLFLLLLSFLLLDEEWVCFISSLVVALQIFDYFSLLFRFPHVVFLWLSNRLWTATRNSERKNPATLRLTWESVPEPCPVVALASAWPMRQYQHRYMISAKWRPLFSVDLSLFLKSWEVVKWSASVLGGEDWYVRLLTKTITPVSIYCPSQTLFLPQRT